MKTIISVDGSKPDVETARKHGLRYIHLPFGYDGVPTNRVVELAKAAQSADGPVYVHCHHGLHRGPAAVAAICEATARWTTNQAVAWLEAGWTASDYAGLYRSVTDFRRPEAAALARIIELPEVAKTSSLVEAMVAIDKEFDQLKAAQQAGWSTIANQPDLTPAHTATILWEHLRELAALTTRRSVRRLPHKACRRREVHGRVPRAPGRRQIGRHRAGRCIPGSRPDMRCLPQAISQLMNLQPSLRNKASAILREPDCREASNNSMSPSPFMPSGVNIRWNEKGTTISQGKQETSMPARHLTRVASSGQPRTDNRERSGARCSQRPAAHPGPRWH